MFTILYIVGMAAYIRYGGGLEYFRDTKSAVIFMVVIVIGFYLSVELDQLPRKLRARKQLAHLSGRAEGRITSHYEDEYETRDPEDNSIHRHSRGTVISYEFDVGGLTYTGRGYGSWAIGKKEHQTICYDPEHPEDNLPLHEVNSKTKTNFIGVFLYVIISFAIFFGFIFLYVWLMKG